MNVRHRGDVTENKRHTGRVDQLFPGLAFERYSAGPHLDLATTLDVQGFVWSRAHVCNGIKKPLTTGFREDLLAGGRLGALRLLALRGGQEPTLGYHSNQSAQQRPESSGSPGEI